MLGGEGGETTVVFKLCLLYVQLVLHIFQICKFPILDPLIL